MTFLRNFALATALATSLTAFAQTPPTPSADWMTKMDQQMTAMRSMHEQMTLARTAQERNALMAQHWTLMQNGMQMMGGMGPGGTPMGMGPGGGGMGPGASGMGAGGAATGQMHGGAGTAVDLATRQQWMEKRVEMMQSMMQLMMDRMQPVPAPK